MVAASSVGVGLYGGPARRNDASTSKSPLASSAARRAAAAAGRAARRPCGCGRRPASGRRRGRAALAPTARRSGPRRRGAPSTPRDDHIFLGKVYRRGLGPESAHARREPLPGAARVGRAVPGGPPGRRETLAARPGFVAGRIGRNVDDPELWVLDHPSGTTSAPTAGPCRRTTSSWTAVPVLSRALDEPSAYEAVEPGTDLNIASTRSIG